jgi:WD40 repeat protein
MDTVKRLTTLLGHQESVNALYWLDESRLMSLSGDRTLRTWNTTTGRAMATRPAPAGGSVFSPDGSRVAFTTRNVIRVWSVDTCRIDRTFMVVCEDQYISITGDGQIDHSPNLRTELVYVLLTEDGQRLTKTRPSPAAGQQETE